MQGGLRYDYWPGWLCLDDGLQRYQQMLKGHIHGLDDDEQHVGFSLQRGDVLTRIVSSFTEATRVEKDCQRHIGIRKIVPGRPARTGRKARANLRALSTGQGVDDRCLPRLHFAKEPDYRWWPALTQTAHGSLERLSLNLRSKKLAQWLKHNNGTSGAP